MTKSYRNSWVTRNTHIFLFGLNKAVYNMRVRHSYNVSFKSVEKVCFYDLSYVCFRSHMIWLDWKCTVK